MSYKQVTTPRWEALAYCLDQARGKKGYTQFAYETGVNMSTLMNISRKFIALPVSEKVIEKILAKCEGRVKPEVFYAANGYLDEKILGALHSSHMTGMVAEDIINYSCDQKDKEYIDYVDFIDKSSFLVTQLSDKGLRAFSRKEKELYANPAFTLLLDEFVKIKERENFKNTQKRIKFFNKKNIEIPDMGEETKKLAAMLEDIIINII